MAMAVLLFFSSPSAVISFALMAILGLMDWMS